MAGNQEGSEAPLRRHRESLSESNHGRRAVENLKRSAGQRAAGGQKYAGVKKQPHLPCWKRCMSASSSAIQPAICSRENFRGSGVRTPCPRSRVARNSISCCFSSGGSVSAAASISSSLLTWINHHARSNVTTIQFALPPSNFAGATWILRATEGGILQAAMVPSGRWRTHTTVNTPRATSTGGVALSLRNLKR